MAKKISELDATLPQVMAIMNVTPDSFSDGGELFDCGQYSKDKIKKRIEQVLLEGANIIDVGGESTRPGAKPVSLQQEMDRVLPVVDILNEYDVAVSVDTSSPELMLEAAKYNIALINDVRALLRNGALAAAAKTGLPVCLMHMQGAPQTMQQNPEYNNLIEDVKSFFEHRIKACQGAGIGLKDILLDPGFGFGKAAAHNSLLLDQLAGFHDLGCRLLVGLSRKSMINHLLGDREVSERLPASLALACMAVERGAWMVRVHDVKETADAIKAVALVRRMAEEVKR